MLVVVTVKTGNRIRDIIVEADSTSTALREAGNRYWKDGIKHIASKPMSKLISM